MAGKKTVEQGAAESIPSMANSAMLDPDDARRLWDLSEALLAD